MADSDGSVGLEVTVYLEGGTPLVAEEGQWCGETGSVVTGFAVSFSSPQPRLQMQYYAFLQNKGAGKWVNQGAFAGDPAYKLRLEGLAMRLQGVDKDFFDISYQGHELNGDTTRPSRNGEYMGSTGAKTALDMIYVTVSPRPPK